MWPPWAGDLSVNVRVRPLPKAATRGRPYQSCSWVLRKIVS